MRTDAGGGLTMASGAYLMNLGRVPYEEAWELQRSLAAAVGAARRARRR